jgi:hypothetical protein
MARSKITLPLMQTLTPLPQPVTPLPPLHPEIGINVGELLAHVDALLADARFDTMNSFGAVNWADLKVVDIEYRHSMKLPRELPYCMVMLEEAAPTSGLARWLHDRLDSARFPRVFFECDW